jgi:hypothetical protein
MRAVWIAKRPKDLIPNDPQSENRKDQATATGLQKAIDAKAYAQPTGFWAGLREKIWQNAPKENGGNVKSLSGTEITPDNQWVMGHKPNRNLLLEGTRRGGFRTAVGEAAY